MTANEQNISKLRELFSKVFVPSKDPNGFAIAREFFSSLEKSGDSIDKMKKISYSFEKEKKDNNPLFFATTFLFAFEGHYMSGINSIIFLLVCYGHDIFDPIRNRYAHNMKEIERIDVEIKFKFLEEHGFDYVIKRDCQTIRNKIAHNDFRLINNSSKIRIAEKEYDIAEMLGSLLDFSGILMHESAKLVEKLPRIENT
jgi:hypothetical protein